MDYEERLGPNENLARATCALVGTVERLTTVLERALARAEASEASPTVVATEVSQVASAILETVQEVALPYEIVHCSEVRVGDRLFRFGSAGLRGETYTVTEATYHRGVGGGLLGKDDRDEGQVSVAYGDDSTFRRVPRPAPPVQAP